MLAESGHRPEVLVLGLGNLLLRDDGIGIELLQRLESEMPPDPRVEFIDGGTQGLALGAHIADRRGVLILDAVQLGSEPGTVHHLTDPQRYRPPQGTTAHAANAGDLLATAELLGDLPDRCELVGIEPAELSTGLGLSLVVSDAFPEALAAARLALESSVGAIQLELV